MNNQSHIIKALESEIRRWLIGLSDQDLNNLAAAVGTSARTVDGYAENRYQWGSLAQRYMRLLGAFDRPDAEAVRELVRAEMRRRRVVTTYNKMAAVWLNAAMLMSVLNAPAALVAAVTQIGDDLAQADDATPEDPFGDETLA